MKPVSKPKPRAKPAKPAKPTKPTKPTKPNPAGAGSAPAYAPFTLHETSPGQFSLLLTTFDPAAAVFEAAGSDGLGYAWDAIARYVIGVVAPQLDGKLDLDPEGSMFCAYGTDRAALEMLGTKLATLFNDRNALAAVIEELGPEGLAD